MPSSTLLVLVVCKSNVNILIQWRGCPERFLGAIVRRRYSRFWVCRWYEPIFGWIFTLQLDEKKLNVFCKSYGGLIKWSTLVCFWVGTSMAPQWSPHSQFASCYLLTYNKEEANILEFIKVISGRENCYSKSSGLGYNVAYNIMLDIF